MTLFTEHRMLFGKSQRERAMTAHDSSLPDSNEPVPALESMIEHAMACLVDFKNQINGAEAKGQTPPWCKSVMLEGIPDLQGSFTITLHVDAERSTTKLEHTHN